MAIKREPVPYKANGSSLLGFSIWDDRFQGRRPGILVVHGGAGLDEHAKRRAQRFAESGYVAFACDLYGEGVTGNRERIMQTISEFQANPDFIAGRALAGLETLRTHAFVSSEFSAVGYCLGGMAVLEMARLGVAIAGAVSVHGGLHTVRPAQPKTVKAKVLVCHGSADPHVPMSHVTAFAEEMTQAAVDWQLILYGGAMHGFTHETATGQQPGVAYDPVADARSAKAICNFFGEIFREPPE
jgi:dienelactone hydrolase